MSAPTNAPLAPFMTLSGGCVVQITALDPATGAVVSAVLVSNASLAVDPIDTAPPAPLEPTSPSLLPG